MKKLLMAFGGVLLLGLGIGMAFAAQTCQRTDMFCYESGPSQKLSTVARMDSSGNLTLEGNETVQGSGTNTYTGNQVYQGLSSYTPQLVSVSSCTIITPTAGYIQVVSTGGPLQLGTCGPIGSTIVEPILSTATATAGERVTLYSTSTINITLSTGGVSGVTGPNRGEAYFVLNNQTTIDLIFDAVQQVWREIGY